MGCFIAAAGATALATQCIRELEDWRIMQGQSVDPDSRWLGWCTAACQVDCQTLAWKAERAEVDHHASAITHNAVDVVGSPAGISVGAARIHELCSRDHAED